MRTFCPETGKEQFQTKGDAERALRHGNRRHKSIGCVYFCPYCHTYHLTSLSYRNSKAKRSRDSRHIQSNNEK